MNSIAGLKIEEDFSNPDYKNQIPVKKVDGVNMPYLQINMTDGTLCDLNGQTRMTRSVTKLIFIYTTIRLHLQYITNIGHFRVLYVCYPFGKHEIYSLEETVSIQVYSTFAFIPLSFPLNCLSVN